MASALMGVSPRKASFSKRAISVTPLTLQLTPNVSTTLGGMSLHDGFVSTLTSSSQLDERNPTNATAMYFLGQLCKQPPAEWVREYYDGVAPDAYVQYLRPNAAENATRLSFDLASGQTLEADGTWAWTAATDSLDTLRQCYTSLKELLTRKWISNFIKVALV